MTLNRKHTFNKQSFQSQGCSAQWRRGGYHVTVSHTAQGDSMPSVFSDTNTVDVKFDKLTVFKTVNNGCKNLAEEILLRLH